MGNFNEKQNIKRVLPSSSEWGENRWQRLGQILSSFFFVLLVMNTQSSFVHFSAIKWETQHWLCVWRHFLDILLGKGLIVVWAKQAAVECDLLQCNAARPFLSARLGRICEHLRVAPYGLCCCSDSLLRQPIQRRLGEFIKPHSTSLRICLT